jgi:ATP-dependent DNA ligase
MKPMLAKAVDRLPEGAYAYEPKWDGFRAIVHRRGDEVEIESRGSKPLTRYFPELVEQFRKQLPDGVVVDGEIIVINQERLDFGLLQQRIHPAQSRIDSLSQSTPASFVAFDIVECDHESLHDRPFLDRREQLERVFRSVHPPLHLTVLTRDRKEAVEWFEIFEGAGLDGIVAKAEDLRYQPDVRAMLKMKHHRSADCVVAGFRRHKNDQDAVGALLLGLYDEHGDLHYVGSTSSFTAEIRREMAKILQPLIVADDHPWLTGEGRARKPGAISRWSGQRDRTFDALEPVLVCEVRYDQLEVDRFRHTTTFLRWRPDRDPLSCRYDQLDLPVRYQLSSVLR